MGAIRKNQIDSELFTPSKYLTLRQEKYGMAAICSKNQASAGMTGSAACSVTLHCVHGWYSECGLKGYFIIRACVGAGTAFACMRLLALAELKVIPNGQAGLGLI